jgi:acetyl-CoA carboxylase carboxyl transferase subunit beta
VIEQVTGHPLPAGAQPAEQLLRRGLLDMIVPRRDLRARLGQLLRLYAPGGSSSVGRD